MKLTTCMQKLSKVKKFNAWSWLEDYYLEDKEGNYFYSNGAIYIASEGFFPGNVKHCIGCKDGKSFPLSAYKVQMSSVDRVIKMSEEGEFFGILTPDKDFIKGLKAFKKSYGNARVVFHPEGVTAKLIAVDANNEMELNDRNNYNLKGKTEVNLEYIKILNPSFIKVFKNKITGKFEHGNFCLMGMQTNED